MKGVKITLLCATMLSIASCIAATSAPAFEGPFYKVAGSRLRGGQTESVEVKGTTKNYVLKATIAGTVITVTCTGSKFIAGATIDGSTGGNAGTSKERFELTGCTQTGNGGGGCTVLNGTITSVALKNTLGYSEAERKGKIQFLYKPESGTEIANVTFFGTCTIISSATLNGSVVAEALSNAATIGVGGTRVAAKEVVEIHFPPTLISKIWVETGGSLKNESTSLEWRSVPVTTFEGESELRLGLGQNWGLYASANETKSEFLSAEWLDSGVAVTGELSTETTGELLFEDIKATTGKISILCSGLLDGWIGPNSLGWTSEVLNLSGEAISATALSGLALECTAQKGCESGSAPKVWPLHLGWEAEVDLVEQTGTFFALLSLPHSGGGSPGWEMECLVLGITVTDECTSSEGVAELTLEGTSLLEKISPTFAELAEAKLATCSLGGEESGVIEGEDSVVLKEGGELTASA